MSDTLSISAAYKTTPLVLKVLFQQQADRWEHRIVLVDTDSAEEEKETTLLKSVEGTSEQTWPPSPPLQDASCHRLETGDALLAVGMAGTSHWSASFSVEVAKTESEPPSMLADLACLFKKDQPANASSLGSCYELGSGIEVLNEQTNRLQIKTGDIVISIESVAGGDWSSNMAIEDRQLTIHPNELSADKRRATRWGFRFSIV